MYFFDYSKKMVFLYYAAGIKILKENLCFVMICKAFGGVFFS